MQAMLPKVFSFLIRLTLKPLLIDLSTARPYVLVLMIYASLARILIII